MARPKGSINKDKIAMMDRLSELGCDPLETMAQFCMDSVTCNKCHPNTHKVSYVQYLIWAECDEPEVMSAAAKVREKVVCPWCAGTGRTILSNVEVLSAAKELLARMHAKLASKKVEKQIRRVRLARMNAVSQERQDELEEIARQSESESSLH